VIIISHNREFCNAVATEKWIMQAGRLSQEGSSVGWRKQLIYALGPANVFSMQDQHKNIIVFKIKLV